MEHFVMSGEPALSVPLEGTPFRAKSGLFISYFQWLLRKKTFEVNL